MSANRQYSVSETTVLPRTIIGPGRLPAVGRSVFPVRTISATGNNKEEQPMIRYPAFGLAVLASLVLCACGGGGSSSTPGFVKVIGVPNVTSGTNFSFDISAVDPVKERMYFTDRNNKSVDVIDVKTNTFLKQITGGFAGCNTGPTCVGANNDMSGPDGLNLITGTPFIYVG